MKAYDPDELLIEVRRKQSLLRTKPGELVQGMAFSALTAQEHLNGAQILIEKNMRIPAFGLFINALEEFGKVFKFADMLISWQEPHKAIEYKKKQKDHIWKLSSTLQMLQKIFPIETISASSEAVDKLKEVFGNQNPLEFLLSFLDPKAAEEYHNMRLQISYTNFDGQRALAPNHSSTALNPQLIDLSISLLKPSLDKTLILADRVLPIYMEPIRECYKETNPKKIKSLKQEINRRVERTLPALRMHLDLEVQNKYGVSIDEWLETHNSKNLPAELLDKESTAKNIQSIKNLIVGHDNIPLIYIFPPLKESAKEYYRSLPTDQI